MKNKVRLMFLPLAVQDLCSSVQYKREGKIIINKEKTSLTPFWINVCRVELALEYEAGQARKRTALVS
jgi:hypothetical protein